MARNQAGEEALLRAEHAVDGARRGAGGVGGGADRQGVGAALGDERLGCVEEGLPHRRTVLARSSHG